MEFLIGIFVGALLCYIIIGRKHYSGTFAIDLTADAEQPIRLVIDENLNDIYCKKHIVLKVQVLEDDSLK